jgi:signal transduction histidine kinase
MTAPRLNPAESTELRRQFPVGYDDVTMPATAHPALLVFGISGMRSFARWLPFLVLAALLGWPLLTAAAKDALTITNVLQLQNATHGGVRVVAAVDLEAIVCAASRPAIGAVLVSDATGVELLELGDATPQLQPGDHIQMTSSACLLRPRPSGVEISAVPVVDNDGHHPPREVAGQMNLSAGYHPLRLEWFNGVVGSALQVSFTGPELPWQPLSATNLWWSSAPDPAAPVGFSPGLQVACYEGFWENLPDFNCLRVVKAGVVPEIGRDFCTQPEAVGLRFTGFFYAPRPGCYQFHLVSDDGAMLFLDGHPPLVRVLGHGDMPVPVAATAGQAIPDPGMRRWVEVTGRVGFITADGCGWQMELESGTGRVQLQVVDGIGLEPARLLHRCLRVRGLGRCISTLDDQWVLGRLLAAGAADLQVLDEPPATDHIPMVLTSAESVQRLTREEADRHLLVRIRGVVTSASPAYFHSLCLQDDTRGLFVNYPLVTNGLVPASGELWEVTGHTLPGDFAPVVQADSLRLLGIGRLPAPVHPTWNQLSNGSMDVQWVEVEGVVTAVNTNQLTLLFPEGSLEILVELQNERALRPFLNGHVRLRGVLFAVWNGDTHEVLPGQIRLQNATINLDSPAPQDAFDAPLKTARELLHFDVRDTAFPRFKVRGQVIYTDPRQIYLMDGQSGLRVLPVGQPELKPGDLVEAVGYPEISGLSPVLREAVLRKTGAVTLPPAPVVPESEVLRESNDATRICLTGKLLGWHMEAGSLVLEMQSGASLFVARVNQEPGHSPRWRAGSQLALTGVCVGQIRSRPTGREMEAFELLVASPADLVLLSQPSWWTLPRMLGLVAVLLFTLLLASLWITQLRRQVEHRTRLLHREIRERETAERQRAVEAERSRIARDLHDDLGSSLTEIGVLASRGARPPAGLEEKSPGLFRDISLKARALIGALDVIVWAVDPEENSLQSLADYLSGYAGDYLASADIACRFRIPVALPPATLDGRVRHDLFLAIKETLHNIVQHAHASEVEFQIAVRPAGLEIVITDNGCGFESRLRDGHGLKNLPVRLAQMGGRCEVASQPGAGTAVKILLPLPAARPEST